MIGYFLSALLSVAAADALATIPSSVSPAPAPAPPSAIQPPQGGRGNRGALFLSPMGEPFRGQATRGAGLEAWFAQVDKDGNRSLSIQEVRDDAARFFAILDNGKDHEIDPDDIRRYENDIAPEIQMGAGSGRGAESGARAEGGGGSHRGDGGGGHRGRGGGGGGGHRGGGGESGGTEHARSVPAEGLQGAGRLGLLNIPEPVTAADADLNRGISGAEYQKAATARFVLLDTNRDGSLSLDELQTRLAALPAGRSGGHSGRPRSGS